MVIKTKRLQATAPMDWPSFLADAELIACADWFSASEINFQ